MSKNDKNIEEEIKEVKDLEDELDELDELDEPKEVTVMDMLNRIVVCLIVIAIILAINTTVLIFKNSNSSNNNTNTNNNNDLDNKEQTSDYDVSMMDELDLTGALKLFDEKDKTYVLYIGRPDCSACISYLPTLQEAQENLGYTTKYINLNNIDTKSDDYTKFSNKLSVKYTMTVSGEEKTETFGTWMGYTPMTIIIKNGKMVDGEIGTINYSTLVSLLKNNGIE